MPKKLLTETGIARILAPAEGRLDLVDEITRGLVLRITVNGVKSWCFVYRFGGVQRRMTFGRYRTKKYLVKSEFSGRVNQMKEKI